MTEAFDKLKEIVFLSVTGAAVDGVVAVVVEKALTGASVVPNTVPFLSGLGPSLEASCLAVASEKAPGELPVTTAVFRVVGGKVTLTSANLSFTCLIEISENRRQ